VGGQTTFNGNVSNTCVMIIGCGNVINSAYVQQSASVRLNAGNNLILFSSTGYVSGDEESILAIDDVSLMFLSASALSLPQGLPINQTNVGNAINNFINGGGTLPPALANLPNFTGLSLTAALSQLDGEASTDAEKGAFQLMNQFLTLMLDPFVDGRFGTGGGGAIGFAPDQQTALPPDIALAYASVLKAPPPSFDQRWTAWGSAFGASSTTNGNAVIGSNNVTANDYGFAAGMDYHVTPSTLYGFALAGGGANWGLAQGLGNGAQ
jgi:hypothetical protein